LSANKKMKIVWNLPNILTMFRVVLIPPVLILIYLDDWVSLIAASILYAVSAITDALDGKIARKLNQQSEFGAFLDPLADKFLVLGCYLVFSLKPEMGIPVWLIVLMALRDIWITWLRSVCIRKNIKFTTSLLAKAKTIVQMVGAALLLILMLLYRVYAHSVNLAASDYLTIAQAMFGGAGEWLIYFPLILTSAIVLFTLYTGLDYYIRIRESEKGAHDA